MEQVLAGSTPVSHPKIRPCSAADQRGSVRRSRSSVQIRPGLPAGVAQWQSASRYGPKPESDSRRRLHAGVRSLVAAYPALTRRGEGSSLVRSAPRFARLAQMVERRSYKPEVPESQAGLGTRFGGVVFNGSTPVLQTGKSGDSTSPPPPPNLGGHSSVAESDIANVGAAGSIPADRSTRLSYMAVVPRVFQTRRSGFDSRHAAPEFSGCRVTGSPPVLGTGRWRFKSSHPDQVYGKWPSAQGAGFGYRRSRVEILPSRPGYCGRVERTTTRVS